MKFKKILFYVALMGICGFSWPFSSIFSMPNPEEFGTHAWLEKQVTILKSHAGTINTNVLRLSLTAYMNALKKGYASKQLLTVIDYTKPSSEKRLWVFDVKNGKTLINTWVTHGKNSGGAHADSFSNRNGSLKSSIGVFVTEEPYIGGNGYSLRLKGLEHGVNDNAYDRNVVIHGAWYVNTDMIKQRGQIGRSWGCPAVSVSQARPLIDTIKENSVVFAYYPDRNWLTHSKFLAG